MLDEDYSERFARLAAATPFDIELPIQWKDFFTERGEVASYGDDQRHSLRLKVRTHGLLYSERSLKFCPRGTDPIGIYTRDFSRQGIGILTPIQFFPEEIVRVVLPTFWVHTRIVRVRRLTSKCFEIGTTLVRRNNPSEDAFAAPTGHFEPPPESHSKPENAQPAVF